MIFCNIRCLARILMGALLTGILLYLPAKAAETVSLSSLDLSKARQDWGQPQADKSVDGHPLSIGGKKFERGFGTHAMSNLYIDLKGGAERFTAFVGIDDEVKTPSSGVVFRVIGDGRDLWKSDLMKDGQGAKKVDVSLKGVKILLLMVNYEVASMNHADWADAKIEYTGERPETIAAPPEEALILTPPPPAAPRINGAKVFGVRPDAPFLFAIPTTGRRPIAFAAENLPEGLQVDSKTGRITGTIPKRGEYLVVLSAKNKLGHDQRELKIVCGDTLALTPPMGWNSWSCFADKVDDAKVRAAADAMVQSGLINHGWTYVNIDNGWQVQPGSDDPLFKGDQYDDNGMVNANKKFPDMKALCDYIHNKGLKTGICSSIAASVDPLNLQSYQLQGKIIQRFDQWGFDYYKFNWLNQSQIVRAKGLQGLKEPYQVLRTALDNVRRDMVFSLCGMSTTGRDWASEVGGNNCCLSMLEITDMWSRIARSGFSQAGHEQTARPGHWNDCGLLLVGIVGWGNPQPTKLTPNEQYTQVSLWCLLSSPLLLGCDLTQLDEFTLNLLTNDEVLEVNQDPLGKQARRLSQEKELEIWAKELENGSLAVGLFNRGEAENKITVKWSDLGLTDKQIVRDLWRQKDLGEFEDHFTATVDRHNVMLVRLRPSGK